MIEANQMCKLGINESWIGAGRGVIHKADRGTVQSDAESRATASAMSALEVRQDR
jgi:hypothetical protein